MKAHADAYTAWDTSKSARTMGVCNAVVEAPTLTQPATRTRRYRSPILIWEEPVMLAHHVVAQRHGAL